jgi:hypothetical protein
MPDNTELVITPTASSMPRLAYNDQIVVNDCSITLDMELRTNGRTVITYRIRMEATNLCGFDDEAREKLLRQRWLEVDICAPCDSRPNWNDVHVRVVDPFGIIPWLFPRGDFSNLFKTLQDHGDKSITQPLRLPSGSEVKG